MAQKLPKSKRKTLAIKIKPQEGLWINYQLRLLGIRQTDLAAKLGVTTSTMSNVIYGKRHSSRIETALYQTLGYPSFETMLAASHGHIGGAA